MNTFAQRSCRALAGALLVFLAAAASAHAAPLASGNSFSLSADVSLLGIPVLQVTPQDQVSFANLTLSYDDALTTPTLDLGNAATVDLSADDLSTEVQWVPGDTFSAVGARASLTNLALGALNPMSGTALLDVSAAQIQTSAVITGSCPAATSQTAKVARADDLADDIIYRNEFELQNLNVLNDGGATALQVDIAGVPLSIPTQISPNLSITIGTTGQLSLNKQTVSGDGIASLSTTNDGLLLDLHLTGLLDVTLDVAHAEASIVCD